MASQNKANTIKVVLAVCVLIVAGVILAITINGGGVPDTDAEQQYFYDLGSQKLYSQPVDVHPPQSPPSGHQASDGRPGGVRAYVFSCGACTADEQYIGYLETYTPETAKAVAELKAKYPESDLEDIPAGELRAYANLAEGRLWAAAGPDPTWLPSNTADGRELRTTAMTKCGAQPAKPCFPTQ